MQKSLVEDLQRLFFQEKLSATQKSLQLNSVPSFLEIAGHTYFFGGFLVGPQFPMKRYLDFVHYRFKTDLGEGLPPR